MAAEKTGGSIPSSFVAYLKSAVFVKGIIVLDGKMHLNTFFRLFYLEEDREVPKRGLKCLKSHWRFRWWAVFGGGGKKSEETIVFEIILKPRFCGGNRCKRKKSVI